MGDLGRFYFDVLFELVFVFLTPRTFVLFGFKRHVVLTIFDIYVYININTSTFVSSLL